MKTRTLVVSGLLVAVVVVLLFTVLNKAWWMKRVRRRHRLPWAVDKDAAQAATVSLGTLIRLARTTVTGELGTGEQGPENKGTASAVDQMLKDAGFKW